MTNIDLVTRLGFIIEQLTKAEDFSIANELSRIQMNLIEERSNAWEEGFNTGYGLREKANEIRSYKSVNKKH